MSPRGVGGEPWDGSAVSAENPWPGLLSFREADQRWFQGRREETVELLQHVKRERLTVLFALSGIGKSSVLQAGLFPALRRLDPFPMFPVYIRLDYTAQNLDLRAQVIDAVAQAAAAAEIRVPAARDGETLWEYFHKVDAEFWNKQQRRVLPLLVFDQFEEIFTLGKSEDRVHASEYFLEELADLAEGTPPAAVTDQWADDPALKDDYTDEGEYKLLISLREDFLPELSDHRRRIAGVPQKRYRLRQMNGEGALLAVSQAKVLIDETVATQVVRYVAAGERVGSGRGRPLKDLDVEPALLSVVCRELNNRRRERGERKISGDLLEGSQEQVLNDFYNRSLAGMATPVRAFVEEQLITVGGARNSVAQDDALVSPGMSAAVIEQLVERRLLRKEYRRNEVRIELTHDLLTGVVRASRDVRRNEEALEKQRKESAEAQEKLRKSRKITSAFAVIAGLALFAAFFAYLKSGEAQRNLVQANAATRVAKENETQAKAATAEATAAKQRAFENLTKAQQEEFLKGEEIIAKENALRIARQREIEARLAKDEALKQQDNTATALKKLEDEHKQTVVAKDDAVQSQQQAHVALQVAEDEKAKADTAANKLAVEKKAGDKELAKRVVSEAADLITTKQFLKALGNVARALTLDGDSMAAKSLAFDQLLRGDWRAAVDPSTRDARQFVHPPLRHSQGVMFAIFSPDGGSIATTSKDNKIRLWDWQAERSLEVGSHPLTAETASFSRDDRRHLLTAGYDGARVWDLVSHSLGREFKHAKNVTSATFSYDGKMIVTTSLDRTAQVWDAATGEKLHAPLQHTMTVYFAAFSPDGDEIVTACGDGKAHVWDWRKGDDQFQVPHQAQVNSAVFSPDKRGSRIVTASSDSTAKIWDVESHKVVELKHLGAVNFATFSPDGRRVATASSDGTARIWDAATGLAITAPLKHNSKVLAATFSPDGHRLVTASDDNTAQVWEVWHDFDGASTGDLVNLLEAIGGYDGKQENGQLSTDEISTRLRELKTTAGKQPATSFLRWFFAYRQ